MVLCHHFVFDSFVCVLLRTSLGTLVADGLLA